MNSFSQSKKCLSLSASLRKKAQPKLRNFLCKPNIVCSQKSDVFTLMDVEEGIDNM
jgi:hypothetical protein